MSAFIENMIREGAAEALNLFTAKDMLNFFERRIQGQGDELKKAVYMVYNYLQRVANDTLKYADNWLLTAPSGSGKTEFYRTVADFFKEYEIDIPVLQIDLSRYTENGFKGGNPSDISKQIHAMNVGAGGYAICFLDEADKKCSASFDSHGKNVNDKMQDGLLTLIEGIKTNENDSSFDSGKTMFVFMGTFQELRKKDNTETNFVKRPCGFGVPITPRDCEEESEADDAIYRSLTIDDIIKYGMKEELAGRIMQVINFHKLSRSDMKKLLKAKAKEISEHLGIKIILTSHACSEFLDISFGSMGLRTPMNKIKSLAGNTLALHAFDEEIDPNTDEIRITGLDEAIIKRKARPAPKPDKPDEPSHAA